MLVVNGGLDFVVGCVPNGRDTGISLIIHANGYTRSLRRIRSIVDLNLHTSRLYAVRSKTQVLTQLLFNIDIGVLGG